MATELPARIAFPNRLPAGDMSTSKEHLDIHVSDTVQSQNFITAYNGRMHASQCFPSGSIASSSSTLSHVLTYFIVPRVAMLSLGFKWHATLTAGASNYAAIRVDVYNTSGTLVSSKLDLKVDSDADGEVFGGDDFQIMMPDQEAIVHVFFSCSGGVVTANLSSFCLFDADLGATELTPNFYPSVAAAMSDGLSYYYPCSEYRYSYDMKDYVGGNDLLLVGISAPVDSEVIDGNRVFWREISTDYFGLASGSGGWSYDKTKDFTIMILCKQMTSSGDHTIFSTGSNKVSFAADNTSLQISVNGTLGSVASALPSAGFKAWFIVHDVSASSVYLYDATHDSSDLTLVGTDIQLVATVAQSPTADGDGLWIGNGVGTAPAESNHQAGEYMSDGLVKAVAIWDDKALSVMEMNHIRYTLETIGCHIVGA